MLISLEGYYIHSKVHSGTNLCITFQNEMYIDDFFVLELTGVEGYIDRIENDKLCSLRIDDDHGSTYALDLSLQKKRPEISKYPEVLLFTDNGSAPRFRAVAEKIDVPGL